MLSIGTVLKRIGQEYAEINIEYCDGFGVSYVTTFQIHGKSDMSVATQQLRVLRLIHAI
jgi:hypothetical protein